MESHLAVNVVGTLLLTCLLLPNMRRTAKTTGPRGRLTIVVSDIMFVPIIRLRTLPANNIRYLADIRELQSSGSIFDKLNDPPLAKMDQRYGLSKISVFYSLREIASRFQLDKKSDRILSVLTQGACKSDIFCDNLGMLGKIAMGVARAALARSTEVGSRTPLYGSSRKLPAEAHGRFLFDNKIAP